MSPCMKVQPSWQTIPLPPKHSSRPDLWRAGRIEPNTQTISTGYPTLDGLLADRGWPKAGLVELLSAQTGIGELRLLGPALAEMSTQEQRWITWINPPHIPYAPALTEIGIDIGKVLLVHPKIARRCIVGARAGGQIGQLQCGARMAR